MRWHKNRRENNETRKKYYMFLNSYCLFIVFASFFDFLDGYFARKFNISSDFGKQADSLSDMISFGVAPAILLFDITKGILKSNLDYTNEIQRFLAAYQ